MINLDLIKRSFRKILSLSKYDKRLIFEALILVGLYRMMILVVPFNKYSKYIGEYNRETPLEINDNDYNSIKRIAWSVNIVSKYVPWESKCFVQALTAQRLLKRRKIDNTLYLGLNTHSNKMEAHAWLRCGQILVTGGNNKNGFTQVAKFGSISKLQTLGKH